MNYILKKNQQCSAANVEVMFSLVIRSVSQLYIFIESLGNSKAMALYKVSSNVCENFFVLSLSNLL